jgi:eukaryotic-like serine/threonine-protein kinase
VHDAGPLPWPEVARLGGQLASALCAVHESGILHGDVKPDNVLVAPARYVLIDLDLARPPGPSVGGRGTRKTMAPEQVNSGIMGPPIDAWGLGIVLFLAATGRYPFDVEDGYPQSEYLAREVGEIREGGGDVAAIIDALLAPLPDERPLLGWVAAELARHT